MSDEDEVVSLFHKRLEHGYPVPSVERDTILNEATPLLKKQKIWTRGRFGGFKVLVHPFHSIQIENFSHFHYPLLQLTRAGFNDNIQAMVIISKCLEEDHERFFVLFGWIWVITLFLINSARFEDCTSDCWAAYHTSDSGIRLDVYSHPLRHQPNDRLCFNSMKLPIKIIRFCKEWKQQIISSLAQWKQLTIILLLQTQNTMRSLNTAFEGMYDAPTLLCYLPILLLYINGHLSSPDLFKYQDCVVHDDDCLVSNIAIDFSPQTTLFCFNDCFCLTHSQWTFIPLGEPSACAPVPRNPATLLIGSS